MTDPDSAADVLVVGASQAGAQLAITLRELGHQGAITLVGAELHPPYQRPPLSKAFLAERGPATALALRPEPFYESARIRLLIGERVTAASVSTGTAETNTGRTLSFDRLALTTGARPRRLPVPGAELTGVAYLRDLPDAQRLAAQLAAADQVVVVGGGFLGLEIAAVARGQGKSVTVVEAADRLLARAVAPVVSEFYRQAHLRRGTRVIVGRSVVAVEGSAGFVSGVQLSDGTSLPADLVLVGIGVVPRAELAASIGLTIKEGAILVDEYARTSDPRVVAAGDCTLFPSPQDSDRLVRLESAQNAVDQAKNAAATLSGELRPYRELPWFWSEQAGLRLQIAGLSHGWDEVVVRGDLDAEAFSALYFREQQLIAIDSVNRPAEYLAARRALSRGAVRLFPAEVAEASVSLKDLLADAVVPGVPAGRSDHRELEGRLKPG